MTRVPSAAVSRLVTYLRILDDMSTRGISRTHSEELADLAHVTAFQIRKDLSYFGSYGTRGVGYSVQILSKEIRQILGLNRRWGVALIGMGRLGQAIANYPGFSEAYELKGMFDTDPAKAGLEIGQGKVESMANLEEAVTQRRIEFGMLTVPSEAAQAVATGLVRAGIKGILNFAPVVLEVPDQIYVENVDFLAGLSRLSFFVLNPVYGEE